MSTSMVIRRVNGKNNRKRGVSSSPSKSPSSSSLSRGPGAYGPVSLRSMAASRPSGPETKWYDITNENGQLYHNASNGVTAGLANAPWYLTTMPGNGTTVNTRIGDRIHIKQVDLRLWLSAKNDRSNVMFRVVVALLPGTASGVAFSTYTSGTNYITAMPQADKALFLYDRVLNPDMNANTIYPNAAVLKERSRYHELTVPIDQTVSVNGSLLTDTANMVFWVVAYDAFGTLATDNIASFAATSRLWFTDA